MKGFTFAVSVVILLQFSPGKMYSRDTIQENHFYRNCIALDVGRFVWNEARIAYERRISERYSVHASTGLQYPTSESFTNLTYRFGKGYEPYYNKVSKGIYIGAGMSVYYNRGIFNYLSLEAYYNYAFYNHKYFYYNGYSDHTVSFESMQQSKTGVKILIGQKSKALSIGSAAIEMDVFAGMGVQFRLRDIRREDYWTNGYNWPSFEPVQLETQINVYPTFHAGVLLGMVFGHR